MSKADVIEVEGTVLEKLPNAMFKVELEKTQPLIDYYTRQGVLKTVDGTRDLNEVFQEIVDILGE